uniref:Peptidase S53 activation domain-containing protein n=1 Tax=Bionectria ochroleuca TaxID=29856 RepID=A0A8H7NN37_BIOOC
MRRLEIVLLASLQLCAARSRGFNVHEDLLTFPQYEVVYSDDKWISEKEAQALLNDNPASQPTISTDLAKSTPHQGQGADEQDVTERSYQIMKIPRTSTCARSPSYNLRSRKTRQHMNWRKQGPRKRRN